MLGVRSLMLILCSLRTVLHLLICFAFLLTFAWMVSHGGGRFHSSKAFIHERRTSPLAVVGGQMGTVVHTLRSSPCGPSFVFILQRGGWVIQPCLLFNVKGLIQKNRLYFNILYVYVLACRSCLSYVRRLCSFNV